MIEEDFASFVETDWPEGARLAILSYASINKILFTLEDDLSPSEMAEHIRNLETIGGATFTREAFETAYDDIWSPTLQDTSRNRYKIIFIIGVQLCKQKFVNELPMHEMFQLFCDIFS